MIKYLKMFSIYGEHPVEFEFVVKDVERWVNQDPLKVRNNHIVCDYINYQTFDSDTRLVVTATTGNIEREFVFTNVLYYEVDTDVSVLNNNTKENNNA